jgi:hypothetical protein
VHFYYSMEFVEWLSMFHIGQRLPRDYLSCLLVL